MFLRSFLREQNVSPTIRTVTKVHTPKAIIYVRGPAPNDLKSQLDHTINYCEAKLGHSWIDNKHKRRAWVDAHAERRGTVLVNRRLSDDTGIKIEYDWSRQQQQTGRRRVLDHVETYDGIDVVTTTINAVARNRKHINELLEILKNGSAVHFVEDGVTLNAPTEKAENIIELGAGLYSDLEPSVDTVAPAPVTSPLDADMELEFAAPDAPAPTATATPAAAPARDEPTGEPTPAATDIDFPVTREYEGGRPPMGFDVNDGKLVSNDHYLEIHDLIQSFRDGEISKREAAKELDVSRVTVGNLADRVELYQLA